MSMSLGIGMGVSFGGGRIDPLLAVLAHRVYGPGYNSGAAPPTGDGTLKTYAANFVNESGAAIETASIASQGWTLRTTGTTNHSATFTVDAIVEYPVGTQVGTVSYTVTPGVNSASASFALSASIPTGGTFRVSLSSTVANGATYIANLGFAGLRNHAKKSTLIKVRLAAFGDSIMTNNSGAVYNAASGRCPAYVNSITGTTANTYGSSGAANFVKQADLVGLLGCTHGITNFGTNDFGAGTALATLQGFLTSIYDLIKAAGAKSVHALMLPRTASPVAETVTATSSSTSMTVTVADASKYTLNHMATIAGATQTEYNGNWVITAIDTGANTLTLLFPSSATTPATGTITCKPTKATSMIGWMSPSSSFYDPGASSPRGLFNAWIRAGATDDYIEWADAVEPSRDAGRWAVADEKSVIKSPQLITVSSVISTSRFNSDYNRGNSTIPNGFVQAITGANAGTIKGGNGNTSGDITISGTWAQTQVVGDTYWAIPGVSYISDDGLHPRVAGGSFGGQKLLDNETIAWIDARKAA